MYKEIICEGCGSIAPQPHKEGCKWKWMTNYGRDFVHSQVYTKTRPVKVRKHWWQFWRPRGPGFIAVGE